MDVRARITALADLMQEFRLAEATLETEDVKIAFRRRRTPAPADSAPVAVDASTLEAYEVDYGVPAAAVAEKPAGTPVASPMAGIFYRSPSPSAPAFVKEGDTVIAGQVIGLIEAMKVFNEIPAPISGVVLRTVAESGQLVQPGETLIQLA